MLISGLYQSSGVVLSSDSASVRGWWPLLFFIAAVAWFVAVSAGFATLSAVRGWLQSGEGERSANVGERVVVAVAAFGVVWFSLDWAFVDSERWLAGGGEFGIGVVLVGLFAVASLAGVMARDSLWR